MITSAVLFVLAVYVVVLVTPGPNLLVVTELAARGDKTSAVFTGIGFGVGATLLAVATVSGLASLVIVAPTVKTAMTIVAASVLVWFGIGALRSAGKAGAASVLDGAGPELAVPPTGRPWRAFARGVVFNLCNPKALAFFIGIYGGPMMQVPLTVLALVLVICLVMEVVWYAGVTWTFSRAPVRRVYARHQKLIGGAAGLCLVALGLGVAALLWRPLAEELGL